jgi:hypothetical protein
LPMMSLSPIRRPHAVVVRYCPMLAGTHRQRQAPSSAAAHAGDADQTRCPAMNKRAAATDRNTKALIRARDQLIPSMTAVIAAPRTAIVAASTVTAARNQRSRRSRRPCATGAYGRAAGIAGRISIGIVDAPCPESKSAASTAVAKSPSNKAVSGRARILPASDERRVN